MDKAGWQALIESKHKTSGIVLSDSDRTILLDYLVSKFGPGTKPFPRTYVPPEITTFFSDPEAKRLLDRACTKCHPLDRVEKARYPEDGWRVLAVDMRERGGQTLRRRVGTLSGVAGPRLGHQPGQMIGPRQTALVLSGVAAAVMMTAAETSGPVLTFTAVTDNLTGAHDSIRIDVFRWSTDAERAQFLDAWNLKPPAIRGRALAVDVAPDPAAVDAAPSRRAAGRGGRGGRGGAAASESPRVTPEASLAAALEKNPPVGRLWSSEVAGYSIRSAIRIPEPDGGERILLITNRRLGAWNDSWKPAAGELSSSSDFSVVELHVNSKGEGESKISLPGKIAADTAAKTIGLENYGALPIVLKNVKSLKVHP